MFTFNGNFFFLNKDHFKAPFLKMLALEPIPKIPATEKPQLFNNGFDLWFYCFVNLSNENFC